MKEVERSDGISALEPSGGRSTHGNSMADKLEAAEKLNKALVGSIGDGIIIVDEYGIINEVNRAALQMLGYKRSEMIGRWLQDALPSKDKAGNDIPAVERPAVKSLITGRPAREITSYQRKDGSLFPVAGTAAPFVVDGKPTGSIIVFRDVSHEMAVEAAKDEFVSLASHQLRTPLTSIRLYLQMIKQETDTLNPDIRNYLTKIEAATIGMMELVDDFLNISKLELGRLDMRIEEVDLGEFIKSELDRISGIASENKIDLVVKPLGHCTTLTDKKLLSEAIHNLLTNAIRYRSDKNPYIRVSLKTEPGYCIITIKDNGIGIPDDVQAKIFDRLFRADNARESQAEGTGLGLYLVKKIAKALGGDVTFSSHEGKGTTFNIKLPERS
jgi:PAS domain S-box-containing protein